MRWLGQYIQDFTARFRGGVYVEKRDADTGSTTDTLVEIDYFKLGLTAASATNNTTGLHIDMADIQTNHASATVKMTGAQIDVDSANAQGTITQKGLILNVAADGVGDAATTSGIEMEVMDGGTDIKMISSDNTTVDYCAIAVGASGATTITTEDGGATAAHFEIAADGNITLDAAGDIALEAEGNDITMDTDSLNITSGTSLKPTLTIEGTNTGSGSTPFLNLSKNVTSVNGEYLGRLQFLGLNSAGTPYSFAGILGTIVERDFENETGKIWIQVLNEGTLYSGFEATGNNSIAGEVNVTIGNTATSTTTIAGSLRPVGQLQTYHANWKGAAGTTETFIPLAGVPDEATAATKEQVCIIMPSAGKIKEIILRMHWTSTITTSDDITWTVYNRASNKKVNSFSAIGSPFTMVNPTQGGTDANNTRTSGEISYAFAEYDAVAIGMEWASTGPTNAADRIYVTVVMEYDYTGIGY